MSCGPGGGVGSWAALGLVEPEAGGHLHKGNGKREGVDEVPRENRHSELGTTQAENGEEGGMRAVPERREPGQVVRGAGAAHRQGTAWVRMGLDAAEAPQVCVGCLGQTLRVPQDTGTGPEQKCIWVWSEDLLRTGEACTRLWAHPSMYHPHACMHPTPQVS